MAKRRQLFRRDADRLSLHFQLFDPVRFDAPFFLDKRLKCCNNYIVIVPCLANDNAIVLVFVLDYLLCG